MMRNEMLELFLDTALKAGKAILEIYNSQDYNVETKTDQSPLTSADLVSNEIINNNLASLGLPILSEENKSIPFVERKNWKEFILVDPLDGTKEFIKGNGEFTVNIALIKDKAPVMGVIYAPVPDVLYWGSEEDGSWKLERASEIMKVKGEDFKEKGKRKKEKGKEGEAKWDYHVEEAIRLNGSKDNSEWIWVVASKSHFNAETEEFIDRIKNNGKEVELVSRGSSLNFVWLPKELPTSTLALAPLWNGTLPPDMPLPNLLAAVL